MQLTTAGLCLCLSGLLLYSTSLSAAELGPTTSRLTLAAGLDSAEGSEASTDLDLGLDSGLHLRGLYGKSWQTSDGDSLQTTSWLVGISSDYTAPLVGGFDYEYWGDAALVETRTSRFKLGTNTENWFLQLSYESRSSQFGSSVSTTNPGGKTVRLSQGDEVDSDGLGLAASYYAWYPWALSLAYMRYSYDQDVTELADNDRFTQVFSIPTTGQATSLESWRASVDVSYDLMWGGLGVNVSRSESAIDQSVSDTASAYVIWDVDRRWSLDFTAGQYRTDNPSDTTTFGRAAISHRW